MAAEVPEGPQRLKVHIDLSLSQPDLVALRDHSQAEYERFKNLAEAALANVVKWEGLLHEHDYDRSDRSR
jgi:hypothetical protein